MRAFPSNSLFGSFSSRVRRSLAADLILAKEYLTLRTSLLFLRPYSPRSFNSWSKLAFSKDLLGVEYTMGTRPFTILVSFYRDLRGSLVEVNQAILAWSTVLSEELQLLVQVSLLEGPSWGGVHLRVHHGHASVHHLGKVSIETSEVLL